MPHCSEFSPYSTFIATTQVLAYQNKEFDLKCDPVGYTLLDLLNFIPSDKLDDQLPNEEARKQRFTGQHLGLCQFTGYHIVLQLA